LVSSGSSVDERLAERTPAINHPWRRCLTRSMNEHWAGSISLVPTR